MNKFLILVLMLALPFVFSSTVAADTAQGQGIYMNFCAPCHASGVAGAPKTGDKAAWGARAKLGLDAMVASVIKGKGAMPPKGGQMSLTDGDIKSAVQYMLEKTGVQPG